jgi:glycosyltransferase involved in cell wall biosynthesis
MEYLITIAIPTYNRAKVITANIEFLLNNLKKEYECIIDILVIDNDSSDDSYRLLSNMIKDKNNYQIFKNKRNIGYARNFLELFTKARGEYLLVTSDEDFINIDNLYNLIDFLQDNKSNILFSGTDKPYVRGCSKLKELQIDELNRSAYLSGGIYNKSIALKHIKYLQDNMNENIFLQLYPQVALTQLMYIENNNYKSYIYPNYIVKNKFQEETFITTGGKSYALIEKRLEQTIHYNNLLDKFKNDNIIDELTYHKLLSVENRNLRKRIIISIRNTDIIFKDVVGKSLLDYYKKTLGDFFYDVKQSIKYKLLKCNL